MIRETLQWPAVQLYNRNVSMSLKSCTLAHNTWTDMTAWTTRRSDRERETIDWLTDTYISLYTQMYLTRALSFHGTH